MSHNPEQALDRLAHDLRTPLTALKMAVSLLAAKRKQSADSDEVALLQALRRNVTRMEEVVAELSVLAHSANKR